MEKHIAKTVESIESTMSALEKRVESFAKPVRKNIFKRFPVFFSLFVTFGIAAVFFGFERLIEDFAPLNDRPVLILSIGLLVLIITGTLYKKL